MLKVLLLLNLLFFILGPNPIYAAISVSQDPATIYKNSSQAIFTFTSDSPNTNFNVNQNYSFKIWRPGVDPSDKLAPGYYGPTIKRGQFSENVLKVSIPIGAIYGTDIVGTWSYKLWEGEGLQTLNQNSIKKEGGFEIRGPQAINPQTGKAAGLPAIRVDTTIWQAKKPQNVYIVNAQPGQDYSLWYSNDRGLLWTGHFEANQIGPNSYKDDDSATVTLSDVGDASDSLKTLCMTQTGAKFNNSLTLSCDFYITGIKITANLPTALPGSVISNQVGVPSASAPPQIKTVCPNDTCDTALGPIETKPVKFIQTVFGILLSLAGGVALLLIIISGYRLMASQGNPEKVQEAREQLTSAIVGLLFVIFSLAILTIIGVDILRIPGFGV